MIHGRIETTPQEQLEELRRAHARYIRLADELKDEPHSEADLEDRKAREEDARRIAHAYERTIANTAARMASLGQAGTAHAPFVARGMILGLSLGVAAAAGIGLVAFLRPAVFHSGYGPPKSATHIGNKTARAPLGTHQTDRFAAVEPELPDKTTAIASSLPATPKPPPKDARQNSQMPKPTGPASEKGETLSPAPPLQNPPPSRPAAPLSGAVPQPPSQTASAAASSQSLRDAMKAPPELPQISSSTVPQTPTTSAASRAGLPAESPLPVLAATQPPPRVMPPSLAPIPERTVQAQTLPPVVSAAPPPPQSPTPAIEAPLQLEPVASTHVPPPYPVMSLRSGEQGTTRMRVSISTQGLVTGCKVIDSSGSDRLDNAACNYVQQHWRWRPPLRGGRAVTAETQISVIWSLRRVR